MSDKPEIILHIGQGKTGTSSIQHTLNRDRENLQTKGFKFLGYNLDYTSQYDANTDYFDHEDLLKGEESRVYKLIVAELNDVQNKGLKLIWSNERLFSLMSAVEIFEAIQQLGYKVTVIAYVRRHDLWSRSAHVQWGIKHKLSKGAAPNYTDWVARSDLKYSSYLSRWSNRFSDSFVIRNYDVISNTAVDFLNLFEIKDVSLVNRNESPSNEMVYMWALYNSLDNEVKDPSGFEGFINNLKALSDGFDNTVDKESFLPSQADLLKTYIENVDDINAVGEILKRFGQPEFNTDVSKVKKSDVNNDKLIEMMFKIIFTQQKQIDEILKNIKE